LTSFVEQAIDELDELWREHVLRARPVPGAARLTEDACDVLIGNSLSGVDGVLPVEHQRVEEHAEPVSVVRVQALRIAKTIPEELGDFWALDDSEAPCVRVLLDATRRSVPNGLGVLAGLDGEVDESHDDRDGADDLTDCTHCVPVHSNPSCTA